MKVLVTGASGTVGGAIVRTLLERGHEVRAVVGRPGSLTQVPAAADAVVADLQDEQQATRLMGGVQGIVHAAQARTAPGPSSAHKEAQVAAADLRMVQHLAVAALRSPLQPVLLYTSGVWAYGDHGEQWIDEDTRPRPGVAAQGHAACAQWLLDLHHREGLRASVMLPGLVYGAVPSFESWFYRPLCEGQLAQVGAGLNHWSLVHADDLALAYALALERPCPGERFNVVDDEPVRLGEFMRVLALSAGCPLPPELSPVEARALLGAPLAQSLALSVRVRNGKARQLLGWAPRFASIHQGLPAVVAQLSGRAAGPIAHEVALA